MKVSFGVVLAGISLVGFASGLAWGRWGGFPDVTPRDAKPQLIVNTFNGGDEEIVQYTVRQVMSRHSHLA